MKVLLDSHVLLWARYEPNRLSASARTVLSSAELLVSVITPWELSGKIARGQLSLPEAVEASIDALGCERLGITFDHMACLSDLEPIHWDPFDRMLLAQSVAEGIPLMTADTRILRYRTRLIRA